jgi:hypothetical protein
MHAANLVLTRTEENALIKQIEYVKISISLGEIEEHDLDFVAVSKPTGSCTPAMQP